MFSITEAEKRNGSWSTMAMCLPQALEGEVLDVVSVQEYGAFVRVVEPEEQVHERRLAGARLPDYGHYLLRLDVHVDVGEGVGVALLVPEGDVVEVHGALHLCELDRRWVTR